MQNTCAVLIHINTLSTKLGNGHSSRTFILTPLIHLPKVEKVGCWNAYRLGNVGAIEPHQRHLAFSFESGGF